MRGVWRQAARLVQSDGRRMALCVRGCSIDAPVGKCWIMSESGTASGLQVTVVNCVVWQRTAAISVRGSSGASPELVGGFLADLERVDGGRACCESGDPVLGVGNRRVGW